MKLIISSCTGKPNKISKERNKNRNIMNFPIFDMTSKEFWSVKL